MARQRFSEPLALGLFRPLERDGRLLLKDQLVERVKSLYADGHLRHGDYLPPVRLLASRLRVSVGTVMKAYEALREGGFAEPHSTRGLRVRQLPVRSHNPDRRAWASCVSQPIDPRDPLSLALPRASGQRVVSFDIAEPGVELLPKELVASAFNRAMEEGDSYRYAPLAGMPAARESIEEYLRLRGVSLARATFLITSGTTQSLALVTRALVAAGGVVLVEHPTWHVAFSVFAGAGVRVIALPVDDEGIQISSLTEAVLRYHPRFLYLQPAFQNPTGVSLTNERRKELVALARRLNFLLVEDDFAAELGYDDEVPAPLRDTDADDVVIYLKSFTKLIAPTLRVGVIAAPRQYEAALQTAKNSVDPFVSSLAQRAVAEILVSPEFKQHIHRLATELRARWQVLDGSLHRRMPPGTHWAGVRGGLCTWLRLPSLVRTADIAQEAVRQGVGFAPGHLFCLDGSGDESMRLSFAATTPAEIEVGVEILASIVESSASARSVAEGTRRAIAP